MAMRTLSYDYDIIELTGSNYCYDYNELPYRATRAQVKGYCEATKRQFIPQAKALTNRSNSLWVLRHYLAMKFVMSASILSGSGIYARDHNLLMAVPYFNYYSLLNCCRGFLMTCPDLSWNGEKTVEMTHSKILNLTGDLLKRLDKKRAPIWTKMLHEARDCRELFSYRFPATGLDFAKGNALDPDGAADLARLIAELAMLNSECFDACLEKYASGSFTVPALTDHEWATTYNIAGGSATDRDDQLRFGKYVFHWGRVSTLEVMATDGLVEDFYGSWHDGNAAPTDFDPDEYMQHLLAL